MTEPAPTAQTPPPPGVAGAAAPPGNVPSVRPELRPIPRWVIWVGMPVMILLAAAAVWLLLGRGVGKDQLDAIRTGGTLGVGLGGVVALWLAVRKQRSAELDLLQKYEAHELARATAVETLAHQQQVAQDARDDVIARRINDLYRQGVDQLGSDKAPVRLGGLYALERLAQDNPDPQLRQTTVNVICAYLRMPYTEPLGAVRRPRPLGRRRPVRIGKPLPPLPQPAEPASSGQGDDVSSRQEREVRLTAQRILENHLKPGPDHENPVPIFWPDIDLDLTGAALVDLNLVGCRLNNAQFDNARLAGNTGFDHARFAGRAMFVDAEFAGTAWFVGAEFARSAEFRGAEFAGTAEFRGAEFAGTVWFAGAKFGGTGWFPGAKVAGNALFRGAEFAGDSLFDRAEFVIKPAFDGAWVKKDGDNEAFLSWPVGWASADSQPVPREGKPGLWAPVIAIPPAPTQANDTEQ